MRTAEQVVNSVVSEYDDSYYDMIDIVRSRDVEFVEFLEKVLANGVLEQLRLLEKCLKELKKGVKR